MILLAGCAATAANPPAGNGPATSEAPAASAAPATGGGDSSPAITLAGHVQMEQSDQSYDCVGYGRAIMQVVTSGSHVDGSFRSDTPHNDPGCATTTVSGTWSGTAGGDTITVDQCSVNGVACDSNTAFVDQGELNLNCSTVGGSGVQYELRLQVAPGG